MGKRGAASCAGDGNRVDGVTRRPRLPLPRDFVAASSSRHEVRGSPSAMGTRGAAAASGADDGNLAEQPPQAHALIDEQILAQLDYLERKILFLQGAIRYLRGQVALRYPRPPPGSPRRFSTLAEYGPAAIDVHDDLSPTSPGSQSYPNSTCTTLPYE